MGAITVRIDPEGRITIPAAQLIDELPASALYEIIDVLACRGALIEQITALLVEGVTDMGSHPAHDEEQADPVYALGKARRRVALASGGIAAGQIAALAEEVKRLKATIARVEAVARARRHVDQWTLRQPDRDLEKALNGEG